MLSSKYHLKTFESLLRDFNLVAECPHVDPHTVLLAIEVLSSIARRRLSASYFSGEFSDRLTEGLDPEVLGVIGGLGEYRGMERGEPIPESTECG